MNSMEGDTFLTRDGGSSLGGELGAAAHRPGGTMCGRWPLRSGIVSLWEMQDVALGALYHCLNAVRITQDSLRRGLLSEGIWERTQETHRSLKKYCKTMDLEESCKFIEIVLDRIGNPLHQAGVAHDLRAVLDIIENEAENRYVFNVRKHKSDIYLKEEKLWEPIDRKFPSQAKDSTSALNCYAIDENTACVFHLMRTAECGLRALPRERRVRVPKRPLEWATWQDILNQIKKSVDSIAGRRAGPAKDAALEFYRGTLGEFEAFKDTYRNNVMHTRRTYDEHQAASVLVHVREFMARLAAKIDERSIKAIRWGRM